MLKSSWLRLFLMAGIVLVGTAMVIASLYPRLQLPGVGEGFDIGFHAAVYGILVIPGAILQYRLRWVAVAVLLFSTLLEGLQYFVPGREFNLSDLAANAIGVLLGLAIVVLWRRQQGVPELED